MAGVTSVSPQMTKEEQEWKAKDDSRVLMQAREIKADKPRWKRAIAYLKKEEEAASAEIAEHKKVG